MMVLMHLTLFRNWINSWRSIRMMRRSRGWRQESKVWRRILSMNNRPIILSIRKMNSLTAMMKLRWKKKVVKTIMKDACHQSQKKKRNSTGTQRLKRVAITAWPWWEESCHKKNKEITHQIRTSQHKEITSKRGNLNQILNP